MQRLSPQNIWDSFYQWIIKSNLKWSDSKTIWTPEIKKFFNTLGVANKAICKFTGKNNAEYLVDLVWEFDEHKRYLYLCLECELSRTTEEGILEDFKKLLDIKSEYKIGIFAPKASKESKILDRMQEMLSNQMYTFATERYVVIFIRENNDEEIVTSCYNLDYKGDECKIIAENKILFKK